MNQRPRTGEGVSGGDSGGENGGAGQSYALGVSRGGVGGGKKLEKNPQGTSPQRGKRKKVGWRHWPRSNLPTLIISPAG